MTILAGLATFERHLIRARTDEGRKRAQARGVRFGRKPKLTAFQIKEALARREVGEPMTDIGRSYRVSHSTISRLNDGVEAANWGGLNSIRPEEVFQPTKNVDNEQACSNEQQYIPPIIRDPATAVVNRKFSSLRNCRRHERDGWSHNAWIHRKVVSPAVHSSVPYRPGCAPKLRSIGERIDCLALCRG